jgi:hypothetical protein
MPKLVAVRPVALKRFYTARDVLLVEEVENINHSNEAERLSRTKPIPMPNTKIRLGKHLRASHITAFVQDLPATPKTVYRVVSGVPLWIVVNPEISVEFELDQGIS